MVRMDELVDVCLTPDEGDGRKGLVLVRSGLKQRLHLRLDPSKAHRLRPAMSLTHRV